MGLFYAGLREVMDYMLRVKCTCHSDIEITIFDWVF